MGILSRIINFGRCTHPNVRCVHGNEILNTLTWMGTFKRSCCLRCGKYLPPLPDICSHTGKLHQSKESYEAQGQ